MNQSMEYNSSNRKLRLPIRFLQSKIMYRKTILKKIVKVKMTGGIMGLCQKKMYKYRKIMPKMQKKEAEIAEEDLEFDDYVDNEIEFDPDIKSVRFFANESIKWYNRKTGAKYKLKRVTKATAFYVAGFSYVITFTAEKCKSGHKRDVRAVKFFACNNEGDEKVFYNSGDDKPSDKLFEASVYWKMPDLSVKVNRCEIKTHEEEGKTEEVEEGYDSEDESVAGIVFDRNIKRVRSFAIGSLRWYKRQRVGQVFFFLLLTGCYVLAK